MADLNLGTYSPEDFLVVVSWNAGNDVGSHIISGYNEGTLCSIAREMQSSTLVRAPDGGGGRVYNSNDGGTITVTLNQFSSSNDVMMNLWLKDKEARNSDWLLNITVVEGTGRSVFHGSQCVIQNLPNYTVGDGTGSSEPREWMFQAVKLDQYIAGSAKIPADVVSVLEGLGASIADKWKA